MSTTAQTPGIGALPVADDTPAPTKPKGNHAPGAVRSCDTTGLPVCLAAQQFVKMNAVLAVVFLLIGGICAISGHVL